MKHQHKLAVFIVVSLIISAIPVISWPLNWIETYFHEISHGLAAILTGGKIHEIVIRLNGSGYCQYSGGWHGLTAFAGYTGAILAGVAMYLSARMLQKKSAIISALMVGLVAITLILYARDIITILILSALIGLFYFSSSDKYSNYFNQTEEFIGIYVLLNAIRSPFHLFDGRHIGDGAALSEMTYLPEIIWVGAWMSIGVYALIMLWRYETRNTAVIEV